MKRFIRNVLLLCIGIVTLSCDKGFRELNRSDDLVENPTLDYLLPRIQLTILDLPYYTNLLTLSQYMGHIFNGGFQYTGNEEDGGFHFDHIYTGPLKNTVDLLERTSEPDLINYHSIGRILKVYMFHRLTDLMGDVPYFEAGRGYLDQTFEPSYDPQSVIYADLFKELVEAAQAFDPAKPMPTDGDIIYSGDIEKWQKFAHSLLLRLAVRVSKVDPAMSQEWVNKAIQGGIMESNDDNCYVSYDPNTTYATTTNGQSTPFWYYPTWKLAAPFVDWLKEHNDPRLSLYSILPNGDITPENQKGLPYGLTPPDPLETYSLSNPQAYGQYGAPYMHLSYAQVQLQLAECAVRGWVDGDAKDYYERGVTSAIKQLAIYGDGNIVSDNAINQYLSENPYNPASDEEAFEMINTQYWIETHYNFYETFANWRRSGYPKLDETLEFKLPRRLNYPASEVSSNSVKVQEAIDRQGPNRVTTRVWWDSE